MYWIRLAGTAYTQHPKIRKYSIPPGAITSLTSPVRRLSWIGFSNSGSGVRKQYSILPPLPRLRRAPGSFFDGVTADFALALPWRGHELADGVEQRTNRSVMTFDTAFEFRELAFEFGMTGQHLTQLDKSAHNRDVDHDGAPATGTLDNMATPCSVKA